MLAKHLKFGITILISLFLLTVTGVTQDVTPVSKDSIDVNKALSIDQISSETETLRNRISGLKKILKPNTKALEVDSILDSSYVEIQINTDTLYSQMDNLSRRELKNKAVTWSNYKSKLKSLQTILNDRTSDITDVNDELVDELEKWSVTKTELYQNSESEDVFASLDTMILTLNSLIDVAHTRLDSVFTIQKRLTELILIVDEAESEINRVVREKQKEYFVFDSEPFWNSNPTDSLKTDSLTQLSSQIHPFFTGLESDYLAFNSFMDNNYQVSIFQAIFLLFFLLTMVYMRHRGKNVTLDDQNLVQKNTRIIFNNPIAATFVLGVLISINFYSAVIPIVGAVHILLVLFATFLLLPKVTTPKMRWLLLLLLFTFIIQTIEMYFEPRSNTVRWMLIIEAIALFISIYWGKYIFNRNPELFKKVSFLFRFISPLYQVILIIALISNLIGVVNLSNMLIYGVLLSYSLGLVVFMAIKISVSILILFFKTRKAHNAQALSGMVDASYHRFQPILYWVGIILWVFFTLSGFDIYNNLAEWVNESLEIVWKVGEMRISLGSILSFITIIFFALISAKIIAAVFQDEWMIKTLPRGVAPAISLLLRITAITIGLYLAFTSAGFNLTELGFVFGALGVGIGFGLQNVVLNFIAGLILAFERPINLGDTIEVDNEMGVVSSIGVRSSNIKTYSGAEAIIPNGDLISKKVVNWTLANRNRRSKILMKTAGNADPEQVIELFNKIASEQEVVFPDPPPKTYFYGYGEDGNLKFALLYWTTFDDTLKTDSKIALQIHTALKQGGIEAPMMNQRNFD